MLCNCVYNVFCEESHVLTEIKDQVRNILLLNAINTMVYKLQDSNMNTQQWQSGYTFVIWGLLWLGYYLLE